MNTNLFTYSSPKVIRHYADYSRKLQPPEKAIFEILGPQLNQMKMIDIGVGGGRTTSFFAPLVKEYLGVDFSEGMINICNNKFKTTIPSAEFKICDVRNLTQIASNYYDIVFFSFNGIDNINHDERNSVLKEIRRICSPQGFFCFSSHNLQYLPEFFKIHFRLHLFKFIKSLFNRKKLIKQNQDSIKKLNNEDFVIIFDDVYDFGLHTYYVRPSYQLKQLHLAGFNTVRLFDLTKGKELMEVSKCNNLMDPWIYYLCQ
jgi:ubiquinone/menaquinone biosynthesis C-methylase UbiE